MARDLGEILEFVSAVDAVAAKKSTICREKSNQVMVPNMACGCIRSRASPQVQRCSDANLPFS